LVKSIRHKRKGNFTLAPESASEIVRKQINKPIPDDDLLSAVKRIFSIGWKNIKLYYMIGFPEEIMDDVMAIATMCNQIYSIGKNTLRKKVKIHVSINIFIPKPHTPFQWTSFSSREEMDKKYRQILDGISGAGIKVDWSDYDTSYIEACLSRGDRRLADVIEKAWQLGCRFDAWNEYFDFNRWKDAFRQSGIDPDFYASREYLTDEILPWDHIDTGVSKQYLIREFQMSRLHQTSSDCRETCHACGIQVSYKLNCDQIRCAD